MLEKIAGILFVLTGLGYIVFPPFYEEGVGKILVPALGLIDLLLAYDLLRGQGRFRNYYLWFAVGGLAVTIPFWGKSSEFYGGLTAPMIAVESAFIIAASLLLISQIKDKYAKHLQR